MIEEKYTPEDWLQLGVMIDRLHLDSIIDNEEAELIQKSADYIKSQLGIKTGTRYFKSDLTGNYYKSNIWIHLGEDRYETISKRKISEEEYYKGLKGISE